jgi:predicted nucleic acid-binding protein
MSVFIDTSAIIALVDADDARHDEAARVFRALVEEGTLVTTNYVEVETLAVARRRLGSEIAFQLIDSLFPLFDTRWVDSGTHAAAAAAYRAAAGPASLVDHVSFAVMRREQIASAFAFDRDFRAQGFLMPVIGKPSGGRALHEERAPYDASRRTDLVSVAEIAVRAGRPINTVQSWRRRHADFPAPVAQLAAGPIWSWPTVQAWVAERRRAKRGSCEAGARHR